ncbi:hypothetical protein [Pararhodobacter zhoushanensis]|uniref:Transposase n=1 Tax=Pararhodobacter zhoushanensis TaxID=2479545 RepID=A0ABT3GYK1_9RHOB|nr:hypothetical protein [Pararhodobacter zhoushanensis]MCW1932639.1 hypothetical protein [Pararhodobacter zhoushanensis]
MSRQNAGDQPPFTAEQIAYLHRMIAEDRTDLIAEAVKATFRVQAEMRPVGTTEIVWCEGVKAT